MKRRAILLAALLGCSTAPPQLLPPPFGPDGPSQTQLFFPVGLAVTADGTLLVANGNFNHAFDGGTILGISKAYLDSLFALQLDCDKPDGDPTRDARCDQANADIQFTDVVMTGNYAGPMVLDPAGAVAITGSRDTGALNAVRVDPGGKLHCLPGAGDDAARDCRKGLPLHAASIATPVVDMATLGVDGPFAIVRGDTVLPGTSAPLPVLFVGSIIPHIDEISSGVIDSSTWVAALDLQDPTQVQVVYTMRAGAPFVANGTAIGPMAFDSVRRQLYMSGCYQRSTALGAGEPGTGVCIGLNQNLLRIMNVDSGAAADPVLIDLHSDVLSLTTTQLLLADPDPASGAPTTLWATMRAPDVLVRIALPTEPSLGPRVREVIPIGGSPGDVVRIDRGSASDLLAVTAEKINSVLVVDTATDQVVAQVARLGDSPFNLQEIPCPAGNTGSACLAASVFGACRLALIEVPKSQPELSKVRALLGSCPP